MLRSKVRMFEEKCSDTLTIGKYMLTVGKVCNLLRLDRLDRILKGYIVGRDFID
jgi:tRNA G37 N-methylase TrmD